MMMALAAIGLATGLASWMGLSPLACIMLGQRW